MSHPEVFWDRIADSYAASPVKDPDAYELTLSRTRSYLSETDKVLEVGCGTGSTALTLSGAVAEITATDFSPEMLGIARRKADAQGVENVRFEVAPADAKGAELYDAAMAFSLLHLVEDLPGTLKALRARIKPGGYLISKTVCLAGNPIFRVIIPVMRLFGKAPFVAYLSPEALKRAMEEAGFEVIEAGNHPKKGRAHFIVARKV